MTPTVRLTRYLRSLGAGASLAALRFPVTVLLVLGLCGISLAEQAGRLDGYDEILRLVASLSAGAAISVAVALCFESYGAGRGLSLAASAGSAALIGGAIWWSQPLPVYAPALIIASLFAVPLAPFAGRGSGRDFWNFTLWTAVGVALAFLSVLVFLFGVVTLLEMIRYLFRTDLLPDLDAYLLTIALTLVGPLFALGRIPPTDHAPIGFDGNDRLVRAVRPLFEWVMAPLVLATALVLHIYIGRIVLSGDLPRGEIGWIVATYALLVLCLRIAVDPFRGETAPLRLFARLWVPILFAPVALLAYALWLRISAEGLTVERYYLGLWGLAVMLGMAAQLVPQWREDIRFLGCVPVLLLALSTFGPWGVAESVGRSQTDLIRSEFSGRLGKLPDGISSLPQADRRRLESRLFALESVAELSRVRPLLAPGVADAAEWSASSVSVASVRTVLGLNRGSAPDLTDTVVRRVLPQPLDLVGYDRGFISRQVEEGELPDSSSLGLRLEANRLAMTWNGTSDRLDLGAVIAELLAEPNPESAVRPAGPGDLVTHNGRHVRVIIEHLVVDGGSRLAQAATLTLLLRSAEWSDATPPPSQPDDRPPANR